LNLASRPFRNERLPTLLLTLAGVALAAVTARHALLVRSVLPDRTSAAHREAATLETELRELRAVAGKVKVEEPDANSAKEWAALKELVDRRSFSWTWLFGLLERVLPRGVRLVSVTPGVVKGQMTLELVATAETMADGLEFIQALEARGEFAAVYPTARSTDEEGVSFRLTMRLLPRIPPTPGEAS
jgi:Tfp pilus assembly protein PilN